MGKSHAPIFRILFVVGLVAATAGVLGVRAAARHDPADTLKTERQAVRPDHDPKTSLSARERDRAGLNEADVRTVGSYIAARLESIKGPNLPSLPGPIVAVAGTVHLVARENGLARQTLWRDGTTTANALDAAIDTLKGNLETQRVRPTTLEVNLAHSFRRIDPLRDQRQVANIYRGIRGLELVLAGGAPQRFAPTEMIAQNFGFQQAFERFAERHQLSAKDVDGKKVEVRIFDADSFLVDMTVQPPRTIRLYRGNQVVPIEQVTKATIEELAGALGTWLFNNLAADGRMLYKYWPSSGEDSQANNTIRQWMATIVMGRFAARHGDAALQARVADNISYNLGQFYRAEGSLGLIDDAGAVKLGSLALAALAIRNHPQRAKWQTQERALRRTIDHLSSPDGRFRTFYRPADRADDNQNFYPGEALLLWATLYRESRDAALLKRFMTSVRWYRKWHVENRNPAFIPWHTQACYAVWKLTKSDELRDWIFEMNDWLVPVQQWDEVREFPDAMGRFYDPNRPFGPPHASSTGSYLEGTVDAWRLATEVGDARRAETYRRTVTRGFRSLLQLAFLDEIDMFYVSKREKVRGGIRTTEYDNEIRVDNVQHSLNASLKMLEFAGKQTR